MPNDQPRPRRNSPSPRPGLAPGADSPDRTRAASRITPPMPTTSGLPTRSASIPTSGENANIPRMCPLMTRPITSRLAPPWSMWIGRHHHHRHHDGVAEGHPDRRGEDERRVEDDRPRPVVGARVAPRRAPPAPSPSGPAAAGRAAAGRPSRRRRPASATMVNTKGPVFSGMCSHPGDHGAGSAEVGSENRTDRRRPHHGAEVAPAAGREREVRGRVPALQVRGGHRARGAPSRRAAAGRTGSRPRRGTARRPRRRRGSRWSGPGGDRGGT